MSRHVPNVGTAADRWPGALTRIAHAVGLAVVAAAVLLAIAVAVPQVVGADHSFVVNSDSMSPAIEAGSIVFVSEVSPDEISEGDVITFERMAEDGPERTTHRVQEVVGTGDDRQFRTKGDANEEADPEPVSARRVVGSVDFHVPLVGYLISFAGTSLGIVLFLIVPAVLLAVTEVRDLLRESRTVQEESDSE